jgi:Na+:H+ antiporter, NhaA family
MPTKIKHILARLHPIRISEQLNVFLEDESISGKLILGATILSLLVVNSPLHDSYIDFWNTSLSLGVGSWSLALDFRHWVNEGLMAFFFLVVGLEIKRELVKGELQDIKTAVLPIGAAVGGMILPALIYLLFNIRTDAIQGWGIPIATDIAFAVAILTSLGKHIPLSLKIFLLTLAIADDIGAIIVIALFYAEIIHYGYLLASVGIICGLLIFRKQLIDRLGTVISIGVVLWITTHISGIHASIVGAAMGLVAPVASSKHKTSVAEKAEKFFLPITTFFILPIFAFANAGFVLSGNAFSSNPPVLWGIVFGLVFGKVLGIVGASWLLTRLGVARLPKDLRWQHIIGVGFIAGIGFTVSIFITELAFADNHALIDTAKIGIFIASALSALIGSLILWKTRKDQVGLESK